MSSPWASLVPSGRSARRLQLIVVNPLLPPASGRPPSGVGLTPPSVPPSWPEPAFPPPEVPQLTAATTAAMIHHPRRNAALPVRAAGHPGRTLEREGRWFVLASRDAAETLAARQFPPPGAGPLRR